MLLFLIKLNIKKYLILLIHCVSKIKLEFQKINKNILLIIYTIHLYKNIYNLLLEAT